MTAADKIASNATVAAISRVSIIASTLLLSAFAYYYVQQDQAKTAALLSAQNQIIELQRWKDVTQQRIDSDLARMAADIKDLKTDTRADLSSLKISNDRLTAAVEGISAQLRMMQSQPTARLGARFLPDDGE